MRKAIFIIIILSIALFGAERKTCVELFTNTSCGPCYSHNIYLDWVAFEYEHLFTLIRTHVHWPSATDPFYTRNTSQAYALYNTRYSVSAVPDCRVDGDDETPGLANIQAAQAIPTSVLIDLSYNGAGTATAQVTVEASMSGTFKIFFVVVEDNLYFAAPNNQRWFHQTMREYFPSTDGTTINLSSVGTQTINQAVDFDLADVEDNCRIVCYIQNMSTLDVAQSDQEYVADYGFRLFPSNGTYQSSIAAAASGSKPVGIYNNHTGDDTYNITATIDAPPSWTITTTADGSAFIGSTSLAVSGESQKDLGVEYNTNGNPGYAKIEFEVVSTHVSGDDGTKTAAIYISSGGNVLVVDDDQGAALQNYFMDAVYQAGRYPYYHDKSDGVPLSTFMDDFEAVVWFTGNPYSDVINSTDISQLSNYLDAGGRLYINGQEIGYDIGGGDGDPATEDPFYLNYLHANFVGDDATSDDLYGLTGDVIGDGLSFGITGGDGANNQNYPDYISGRDGAVEIFGYGSEGSTQKGMIRWTNGSTYLVYSGFGFEGIDNESDRNILMRRILDWFEVSLKVDENQTQPDNFKLSAYPNPFNSALSLDIPTDAIVYIYDIHGKLIDTIHDNKWIPAENINSGTYLIKASKGKWEASEKVLYIK